MQNHNLGSLVVGGIGIPLIIVVGFFYTIPKWSYKKNGLTAPTLLANISTDKIFLKWKKVKQILLNDFCEAWSKDCMWRF